VLRYAEMVLHPREFPNRLHVEVATAVAAPGELRAVAVESRLRPATFDPPFRGGPFVDVLLEGRAHAASPTATSATVTARVGDWSWEATVWGRRTATSRDARIRLGDPSPLAAPVPISFATAFGGAESGEPRTSASAWEPAPRDVLLGNVYPRNPFGRGYRRGTQDGTWELPQIEDPRDFTTADRLERVATDDWTSGPLPWCLDEVHTTTFPRCALVPGLGASTRRDDIAEVSRGFLRAPPEGDELGLDTSFLQDAPPWGWLDRLDVGAEVEVRGCLPDGETFAMRLPPAPPFYLTVDGVEGELPLRCTRLTIRPEAREVLVSWTGDVVLPRPFLPGIHARIPIAVRMAGLDAVPYPTPPVMPRPRFTA
jgi:hypothetical protein